MKRLMAGLVLASAALLTACSTPEPDGFDLSDVAAQSGTDIRQRVEGDVQITEIRRGGVTVIRRREGDQISMAGYDSSPHGAVGCAWKLAVDTRYALDLCFTGQYPDVRASLNESISRMNAFIVENSLTGVSHDRQNLNVALEEDRLGRELLGGRDPAQTDMAGLCLSGDFGPWFRFIRTTPNKTFRQEMSKRITDLLSVPRPSVDSPCL